MASGPHPGPPMERGILEWEGGSASFGGTARGLFGLRSAEGRVRSVGGKRRSYRRLFHLTCPSFARQEVEGS
jgi:hypothetical protein